MSDTPNAQTSSNRPQTLHVSKSFTRMDLSPGTTSPRKRASTMQSPGITAIPEAKHIEALPETIRKSSVADVFESREDDEPADSGANTPGPEIQLPSTFDELPIEIRSLSERFLESLSAKVHPTPLNADALADLFQDFYVRAESHIATHIASLASRIGREKWPTPSASSKSSAKGRAPAGSGAERGDSPASNSGGEMLTASEVAHRRKARKMLELKRTALEEAVERGVCEKIYDRIWKHRSTDDDARDEKLRSRTAALALVGIGLKELHMDADPAKESVRQTAEEKEDEIHQSLAGAREALQRMDEEHYPLGKLQHLTAAHKSIVETLSQLFPSSSSADEILPTLIYTLITSPPEGINVVSNLNFIQRFRTSSKVDGEAAYCLVNLEAAISFLETVDLSSLRSDELPEGPAKSSSGPSMPTTEKPLPARPSAARTLTPGSSPVTVTSSKQGGGSETATNALKTPASPTLTPPTIHQRRLSSMVQARAGRIEDARENFVNAADKAYDSINNTLENSFKFVFGRFKEQQASGDSPLPKTLEEARRLVSSPSRDDDDDTLFSSSGRNSPATDDPLSSKGTTGDSRMLELLGGRKPLVPRDRSVDSTRSAGSGKRVAFAEKEKPKEEQPLAVATNFINNINPLNRFGVPGFVRFGRSASTTTPSTPNTEKPKQLSDIVESPSSAKDREIPAPLLERSRSHMSEVGRDLNAAEALAELRKIKPPKKRFMDVRSAGELRIGEVEELLREYRRLAKAIGEAVAS